MDDFELPVVLFLPGITTVHYQALFYAELGVGPKSLFMLPSTS